MMDNVDLDLALKKISSMPNFIEAIVALKELEPEYKKTDFYKSYKIPLMELMHEAKFWYTTDFSQIQIQLQNLIDGLDLSQVNNIINQISDTFEKENGDILKAAQTYKDLLAK